MSHFDSTYNLGTAANNYKPKTTSAANPSNARPKPWQGVDGDGHCSQPGRPKRLSIRGQQSGNAASSTRPSLPVTTDVASVVSCSCSWSCPSYRTRPTACSSIIPVSIFCIRRGDRERGEEEKGINLPWASRTGLYGLGHTAQLNSVLARYRLGAASDNRPPCHDALAGQGCRDGGFAEGPRRDKPARSSTTPGVCGAERPALCTLGLAASVPAQVSGHQIDTAALLEARSGEFAVLLFGSGPRNAARAGGDRPQLTRKLENLARS